MQILLATFYHFAIFQEGVCIGQTSLMAKIKKAGIKLDKGIKERGEEHAMVTKRKVDNIIPLS